MVPRFKDLEELDRDLLYLFEQVRVGDISGVLHLEGLSQSYKMMIGNSMSDQLMDPDGTFTPSDELPYELIPIIKEVSIRSFDKNELVDNYRRRMDILRTMTKRSLNDILWYRQLFRDLRTTVSRNTNEILDPNSNPSRISRLLMSVTLAATALSELLYDVSASKIGGFKYILGVTDDGEIYSKSLPGLDLNDTEHIDDWFDYIFEMGGNAIHFYSMDPRLLDLLIKDGEIWTHKNPRLKYPNIGIKGFEIADQFLRFGQDHKVYFSPHPHEVIIRTGDIDTITVVDRPESRGVIYKVKHSDRKVTVGTMNRKDDDIYSFEPSDFIARAICDGLWRFHDYGDVFALVGAIARDMFVCEEKHTFYRERKASRKRRRREREQEEETEIIRWIPRFKIIYHGDGAQFDSAELEEMVFSVAPHYVTGHIRRVEHASPRQLELATQYGVVVPEGYTYVRPYHKGEYEVHRPLYKSRSALETLFGAKIENS